MITVGLFFCHTLDMVRGNALLWTEPAFAELVEHTLYLGCHFPRSFPWLEGMAEPDGVNTVQYIL
jgi:hypothetical protein